MEKVDIYNKMAQYNFSTPINVTIIFEDHFDEENSNGNILKKQLLNNNNTLAEEAFNFHRIIRNLNDMYKTNVTNELISKNITEDNNKSEQYVYNSTTVSTVEASNVYNQEAIRNDRGFYKTYQTNSRKRKNEPSIFTSYFNKTLKTVSKNIVLFMRRHYYYYYYNKIEMDAFLTKELNNIFDLSYSTVVSLILPHEKNKIFMNLLIEKTVFDANKIFKWKCQRKYVETFYNEMITWAKNKNESRLLKQGLMGPEEVIGNLKNNVCIFSTGEPGKEISISVTPDLLNNHFMQKQTNSYKNTKASNDQHELFEEEVNHLQYNTFPKSSTIKAEYKQLPSRLPPPNNNQYHNILNTLNNYDYNINRIQQIAQKFPYTTSEQQYSSQVQGQHLSPTINNMTVRYPSTFLPIGRCSMSGKETISKCSKCHKFSYCSTLCQVKVNWTPHTSVLP